MARRKASGRGHHEAVDGRHGRSLAARVVPFAPPWLLAGAVPVVGLGLHQAWGGDAVTTPLAAMGMATVSAGLAGVAWAIGRKAGREAIIRWHTTVTVAAAGAAETGTMIAGLPRPWLDLVLAGGAALAASWNLRGFDALRSDSDDRDGDGDSWGQVLGMPKTRPGKAKVVGARIEVPLHHGPGETVGNAQRALPQIEAARGVPAGRSRVVPDPDDAGRSTLVLIEHDVLKDTIVWPGPSAPGGSIVEPLRTGLYEDDEPVLFWLPPAPSGAKVGRPPTNVLYMGITRSGKTVAALINTAEVMTRRDVVVLWADASKGEQTAGPIRAGLTLYADTVAKTRVLFKGVKAMVKARANLLGQHGFRQWEPAVFDHPGLRMPYVVVHLEEADEYIGTDEFVWLTSKCLSTGVSVSVSLQRASHSSMPTDARYNVGAAYCFGVGDDYSAAFALSDSTIKAGARPESWKARKQGYFYLETPGVEEERFPVPARAFYATDDEIAAAVAGHAGTRAVLDEPSRQALGDAWKQCQPAPDQPGPPRAATPTRSAPMPTTTDDDPDDVPDEIATMRHAAAADIAAEFPTDHDPLLPAGVDPAQPLPAHHGPDHPFTDARPDAATQEEAEAAFDAVLRELAAEGRPQGTVTDLLDRYPYRSRTWFSRRLSAVAEGVIVAPPGLVLARTDRNGVYDLYQLATTTPTRHAA